MQGQTKPCRNYENWESLVSQEASSSVAPQEDEHEYDKQIDLRKPKKEKENDQQENERTQIRI